MDFSENMFGEYDDHLTYDSWGPEHAIFIPTTAVKLENMASVTVAIALWNRANDGVRIPETISNQYDPWCASFNKEVCKRIKALPVPKSCAASIMAHFCTVSSSIRNWVSYLFQTVFFDEGKQSDLNQYLGYIIWHPNGIVNSAETARNLLKCNALSVGKKFRLACTYCLQEDIVRIWPTVKYDHQVVSIEIDRSPFLMYYWKCYCAGQLRNIRVRSDVSIEEYMIRKPSVHNWPAIEYFFDRLDAERRVPMVISLIDDFDGHGGCFQKLLLLKLEESQRLPVIMDQLTEILRNYAEWEDNEEIINTWYYVRDIISERDFLGLFDVLFDRLIKDFVLAEIWNTARYDFKRYVLNYGDDYFITNLFRWCERKQENRLNFLSLVLLDPTCADIRREITKKKLFSEWCLRLITLNDVKLLSHLVNVCFPAAVESMKFRLSLIKTPCFKKQCKKLIIRPTNMKALVKLLEFGYPKTDPSSELFVRKFFSTHLNHLDQKCLTYYSKGYVKLLNDLLAPLVSSYPEIMSNYKSKLLMSRPGFRACFHHFGSRNNVLAEIVADGLPAELATEFKKRIILSPEGIDKVEDMVLAGPLRDAEECARWFLESDSDKKVLRTILVNRLKDGRFNRCSDESRRRIMEFLV